MSAARSRSVAAAALLVALAGCGAPAANAESTYVHAAASLARPFEALAAAYRAAHPDASIRLNVQGTPRLVMMLREGAEGHVFASADRVSMQRVVDAGLAAGAPMVFAKNRLAICVRSGNPRAIRSLRDLARPDIRMVLCGPEVPAGRYARVALQRAGVAVRSRSDEPSVRAVLSRVELDDADAGIVYATDVVAARGRLEGIELPVEHQVEAEYPIVALVDGRESEHAAGFVAFVRSRRGRAILRDHGFEAP